MEPNTSNSTQYFWGRKNLRRRGTRRQYVTENNIAYSEDEKGSQESFYLDRKHQTSFQMSFVKIF
jgi:hypothetical protein